MSIICALNVGSYVTFNETYHNITKIGKVVKIDRVDKFVEVITIENTRIIINSHNNIKVIREAIPLYAIGDTIDATIDTGIWEQKVSGKIAKVFIFGHTVRYTIEGIDFTIDESDIIPKKSPKPEKKAGWFMRALTKLRNCVHTKSM